MKFVRNSDGTYSLAFAAADVLQAVGGLDMAQLATDAGQGTTTTPPPPPPPPPPVSSGFRGIFAFNSGNSPALASNPSVAGTELDYYWSQLEPQQGQYNWSLIDNDLAPWVAAGKGVTIRIKTAGWKNWQPPYSAQGTPQWVFDQGVPFVTDDDGSKKPQYWHLTFLRTLSTFVQALAARYDGNPHVVAIEIGVGDGGETKPDTSKGSDVLRKWQAIGYTDALWWGAIQGIISMYVAAFKETPLVLMPNASFLGGTKGYDEQLVVNYAARYGVWMQWNGLVAGASLPGSFGGLKKGYPVLCEQLNAAGPNKRKLADDLQTALNLGAVIALVFTSDLQDPANAATLATFAALAGK